MSRQNKVNPGQYTQRGRLTQDDAARELKQQRSIGSQHTWQPVQKDQMPRPRLAAKDDDADRNAETSGDKETEDKTLTAVNAKPAPRVTRAAPAKKAAPVKSKAKTRSKAKAAKTAKPAAKRAATKTVRKAVLARNVGGGPRPRTTAKRRKS